MKGLSQNSYGQTGDIKIEASLATEEILAEDQLLDVVHLQNSHHEQRHAISVSNQAVGALITPTKSASKHSLGSRMPHIGRTVYLTLHLLDFKHS